LQHSVLANANKLNKKYTIEYIQQLIINAFIVFILANIK